MKLLIWGLQIAGICSSLLPTLCAARDDGLHLKVTGKRNPPNSRHSKRGNIIGSSTLSNAGDISYYTNITLGGGSFSVLIGVCDPLSLRLMLNSNTLDTGRYIYRVSKENKKTRITLTLHMCSSDLWVAGSVPEATETGKNSGVTYAIGSVKGPLSVMLNTCVVRSSSCMQDL